MSTCTHPTHDDAQCTGVVQRSILADRVDVIEWIARAGHVAVLPVDRARLLQNVIEHLRTMKLGLAKEHLVFSPLYAL